MQRKLCFVSLYTFLIKKRGNKYENHSFASENFCIFASKIQ